LPFHDVLSKEVAKVCKDRSGLFYETGVKNRWQQFEGNCSVVQAINIISFLKTDN